MTVEIGKLEMPSQSGIANPGQDIIRLRSPGGAVATIHPGVGFNVFDWRTPDGLQLLHAEPDVLSGGSGTRSGTPILFPFPNRIEGARFEWEGRTVRLPESGSDPGNAIHGFCAKTPWSHYRESGAAAVTGEFLLSRDAPEADWPGDLQLSMTIRLTDRSLRFEALVENPSDHAVPFGLGYHPYFAPLGAMRCDDVSLWCPAEGAWDLDRCIPTGAVVPVSGERDLRAGPQVGARVLDDVLTDLPDFSPDGDGLMTRSRLSVGSKALALRCDAFFRDVVVFTPPDRRSLAVEPYTCPTDAVHLAAAGRDVGWRVLGPAESWTGIVEFAFSG